MLLVREKVDILTIDSDTQWIIGELGKPEIYGIKISEFDPDVCMHLAWEGIPDFSKEMCQKNLKGSMAFLNWVVEKTHCKKIVVTGSCAEYTFPEGKCQEVDSVGGENHFSSTKNTLYRSIDLSCRKKSIELFWFRLFYVYGDGQRDNSLLPSMVNALRTGKALLIQNPHNANDFIHVWDVVNGLLKAMKKGAEPGVYNLGSGEAVSVLEIVPAVEK